MLRHTRNARQQGLTTICYYRHSNSSNMTMKFPATFPISLILAINPHTPVRSSRVVACEGHATYRAMVLPVQSIQG